MSPSAGTFHRTENSFGRAFPACRDRRAASRGPWPARQQGTEATGRAEQPSRIMAGARVGQLSIVTSIALEQLVEARAPRVPCALRWSTRAPPRRAPRSSAGTRPGLAFRDADEVQAEARRDRARPLAQGGALTRRPRNRGRRSGRSMRCCVSGSSGEQRRIAKRGWIEPPGWSAGLPGWTAASCVDCLSPRRSRVEEDLLEGQHRLDLELRRDAPSDRPRSSASVGVERRRRRHRSGTPSSGAAGGG